MKHANDSAMERGYAAFFSIGIGLLVGGWTSLYRTEQETMIVASSRPVKMTQTVESALLSAEKRMLNAFETLHNAKTQETWWVVETENTTQGQLWEMYVAIEHKHPYQSERITVLRGSVTCYLHGRPVELREGYSITVPAGLSHGLRNRNKEHVLMGVEYRPSLQNMDLFFRTLAGLSHLGYLNHQGIPDPFHTVLIWRKFPGLMSFKFMPEALQDMLGWLGAPVSEVLGFDIERFHHRSRPLIESQPDSGPAAKSGWGGVEKFLDRRRGKPGMNIAHEVRWWALGITSISMLVTTLATFFYLVASSISSCSSSTQAWLQPSSSRNSGYFGQDPGKQPSRTGTEILGSPESELLLPLPRLQNVETPTGLDSGGKLDSGGWGRRGRSENCADLKELRVSGKNMHRSFTLLLVSHDDKGNAFSLVRREPGVGFRAAVRGAFQSGTASFGGDAVVGILQNVLDQRLAASAALTPSLPPAPPLLLASSASGGRAGKGVRCGAGIEEEGQRVCAQVFFVTALQGLEGQDGDFNYLFYAQVPLSWASHFSHLSREPAPAATAAEPGYSPLLSVSVGLLRKIAVNGEQELSVSLGDKQPAQGVAAATMLSISPSFRRALLMFHPLLPALRRSRKSVRSALFANSPDDLQDCWLLDPALYVMDNPGKGIRSKCVQALARSFHIHETDLVSLKRCIDEVHEMSLLIDDIQDNSSTRRNRAAAHVQFGTAESINAAYMHVLRLVNGIPRLFRRHHARTAALFTAGLVEGHRGQGKDIYWRIHGYCPTEAEYLDMVRGKTAMPFVLLSRVFFLHAADYRLTLDRLRFTLASPLLHLARKCFGRRCSWQKGWSKEGSAWKGARFIERLRGLFSERVEDKITLLLQEVAIFFQIRDDYINLADPVYWKKKGCCDDLHEKAFSFPVIRMVQTKQPGHKQLLAAFESKEELTPQKVLELLRCVCSTDALSYTHNILLELRGGIKRQIERMNIRGLDEILSRLTVAPCETSSILNAAEAHMFSAAASLGAGALRQDC